MLLASTIQFSSHHRTNPLHQATKDQGLEGRAPTVAVGEPKSAVHAKSLAHQGPKAFDFHT
jgi:hypothetical protein